MSITKATPTINGPVIGFRIESGRGRGRRTSLANDWQKLLLIRKAKHYNGSYSHVLFSSHYYEALGFQECCIVPIVGFNSS